MLLGAGKGSRDVSLISRWLLTTSFVMYGIPGKTRRDGPAKLWIRQVKGKQRTAQRSQKPK